MCAKRHIRGALQCKGNQSVMKALLALEDGNTFWGTSIGASGQSVGELVFNTAMTGYQEILTDPSYARQLLTLTYPHIGNTGVNGEDQEADHVWAAGLVIRDLSLAASNYRCEQTLGDYLIKHHIVGVAGIDTRRLTRLLRDQGAKKACLVAGETIDQAEAVRAAKQFEGLVGMDLAKVVGTESSFEWRQGSWQGSAGYATMADEHLPYHVVVYDFGVKKNLLRLLVDRGCRLTVVSAQTTAEDVLALQPDGVFLSNGPGDPQACSYAIKSTQQLLDANIPLFGICLGHQLLALACGAKTIKMNFGHHGANHPVQRQADQQVMITSQNHGFVVDEASLPQVLKITHRSLFDGTLQGINHRNKPAFGFQGHPEGSPGPHDAASLFDEFVTLMH